MMRAALCLMAALLFGLAAAAPQPDAATMERCRERMAFYVEQGVTGADMVARMRAWFGHEFEGQPDRRDPARTELYLVRRDASGEITYRAVVGSFN